MFPRAILRKTRRAMARFKFWDRPVLLPDKLICLKTAVGFSIANNVCGDYFEFGVYEGKSFIQAYLHHQRLFLQYRRRQIGKASEFTEQKVRFIALDSFEGLPQVNERDLPLHWRGKNVFRCPRDRFEETLRKGK